MKQTFRHDLRAASVVALIALPLCLGIALASGAPLISGIVSGVVGGIVVGLISRSTLSVSGPAAGLTVLVLAGIAELGGIARFLPAVIVAGMFQLVFGAIRAGELSFFVPASVIKGMTAAIGLILVLKQLPHAVGYDRVAVGDEAFQLNQNENTFTALSNALQQISPGAAAISFLCLMLLMVMELPQVKRSRMVMILPGPLLAVLMGIGLNHLFIRFFPALSLSGGALVEIPLADGPTPIFDLLPRPEWTAFLDPAVWSIGLVLAIIASLESLLAVEAIDKQDPYRRVTPPNRELVAQGVGNICAGLAGGIPVTAVIVRSSANLQAGARTKLSAILHGVFLCLAVVSIPHLLNMIPLAALAAILIRIGYKLAGPSVIKETWREGVNQIVPFLTTIVAVLLTDLLIGVLIGIAVGLVFVVRTNFHAAVTLVDYQGSFLLKLEKDVSFLNKALVTKTLEAIPAGSKLLVDGSNADFIDHDILELIVDYQKHAMLRDITVTLEGMDTLRHTLWGVEKKEEMENGSDTKIAA